MTCIQIFFFFAHVSPDQRCSVSGISIATAFGSAGVYASYNISGDTPAVTFGLHIDLCVSAFFLTTCASKSVPYMPVTLIKGAYDFSSICL